MKSKKLKYIEMTLTDRQDGCAATQAKHQVLEIMVALQCRLRQRCKDQLLEIAIEQVTSLQRLLYRSHLMLYYQNTTQLVNFLVTI